AQAEVEAKEKVATAEGLLSEKEEKITRQEERVFKREEALDKKQTELDKEIEVVRGKIEEVKSIKERAENLVKERADELARVAGLTKEQAKEQLFEELSKESEEDFMVRLQKLEQSGMERLERRARDILVTSIHRLGNSVAQDTMA